MESDENCNSCKQSRTEFEKQVLFIRKYGERQKMLNRIYTVFCLDEREYWTMGDPLETTWVLNRALIDEPRRALEVVWVDMELQIKRDFYLNKLIKSKTRIFAKL